MKHSADIPRGARAPILAALLVICAVGTAVAEEGRTEEAQAEAAVRRTLEAALRVVEQDGTRNEKLAGLRRVARSLFDTRAMGRSALGDVLAGQPTASQEEFLALFDEFIVRAYLQKILFFRKPRFGFGRTVVRDEDTVVHTLIKTPKDEYYVDYVLRRTDGRWQANDIVVEGVSLARNHGEQFRSLLRHESFDELLGRMRRKVERQRARERASS